MTATVRHLALFVPTLSGGGVQRNLLTMARGFHERGYRVDLVVVHAEGQLAREIPEGVRLVELERKRGPVPRLAAAWADWRGIPTLARPLLLPLSAGPAIGALPALARYLHKQSPDIFFSAKVSANITALLAKRLSGAAIPIIVSERESYADKVAQARRWRWRHIVPAIRHLYPSAAAIVAVSEGTAEEFTRLTKLPREAVQVIYNPVVGPALARQAIANPGHPWLPPDRPVPVILGVGRLEQRKGFDVLLQAVARLRADRRVRLLLLGEGEARAHLAALGDTLGLGPDLDMPGWQTNPFAFMARADVFVLASDFEGLPGVLIQALACGCPVVSTDCPDGPREILQDGQHGQLVPTRNPAAMAEAIRATLNTAPAPEALRARAMAFGEMQALDHFEALFETC